MTSQDRGSIALECFALLGIVAVMHCGFTAHVDLHVADEVVYLENARTLFGGAANSATIAYAPVYTAFVGLLDLLWPFGSASLQPLVQALAVTAATYAMWWALRGALSARAAFLASCCWAVSVPLTLPVAGSPNGVYLFTATWMFVALGCIARDSLGLGLGFLLLAALNRIEVSAWLLLTATLLAARTTGRRRTLSLLFAGCALAWIGVYVTFEHARGRSWLTFSQHFALGMAERTTIDREPMTYHEELTRGVFPTADSVFGALAENPGAFAEHVAHNASLLGDTAVRVFASPLEHVPHAGILVLLAVAAALIGARVTSRGRDARPRPIEPFRLACLAAIAALPIALLVRPRVELMFPLLVPVTYWVARLGGCTGGASIGRIGWAPAAVIAIALVMPRRFPADSAAARPWHEAVTTLHEADLEPNRRLFATMGPQLRILADRSGPSANLIDADATPDTARVGDRLLLTKFDLVMHGARFVPWATSLQSGDWRMRAAGFDVWLFERRAAR